MAKNEVQYTVIGTVPIGQAILDAITAAAGERCRICGKAVTIQDIKDGAVYAGREMNVDRLAHRICWERETEGLLTVHFRARDPLHRNMYLKKGYKAANGGDPSNYTNNQNEAGIFDTYNDPWMLSDRARLSIEYLPEDQNMRAAGASTLPMEGV